MGYNKRKCDRIARRVKHNDGIKDVAKKLIDKIKKYISDFKGMKPLGKVVFVLNKLVQALAGFYAAKSLVEMKNKLKIINKYKDDVKAISKDRTVLWPTGTLGRKEVIAKQGLKAIIGLTIAFVSLSKEKIMREGLPDDYDGYEE